MVELLRYLEANGFTTFIASGGNRDFMRGFAADIYGIPPERIIGSSNELTWVEDGDGSVVYAAAPDVFDDGPAKPVRIWSRIGRRPLVAGGNSNGDIPMLALRRDERPPGPPPARPPRRRGAGVRLRQGRRDGARAGAGRGLDRHQREGRLGDRLRRPVGVTSPGGRRPRTDDPWLPILDGCRAISRHGSAATSSPRSRRGRWSCPQAIAYAEIAGLPPQAGLAARSSRPVRLRAARDIEAALVSPTSSTAAISFALVGDDRGRGRRPDRFAVGRPRDPGRDRLRRPRVWRSIGFIARFIPTAVQVGFMFGLGLTIIDRAAPQDPRDPGGAWLVPRAGDPDRAWPG